MVPAAEAKVAQDSNVAPWAERRLINRQRPRPGTRIELRPGVLGLSPDVVIELIDLTEAGAKVRMRGHIRRGDRLAARLSPPSKAWRTDRSAVVQWCVVESDGTALVGIQFQRPLVADDLSELVSGPI
jgi:hypothetical protein